MFLVYILNQATAPPKGKDDDGMVPGQGLNTPDPVNVNRDIANMTFPNYTYDLKNRVVGSRSPKFPSVIYYAPNSVDTMNLIAEMKNFTQNTFITYIGFISEEELLKAWDNTDIHFNDYAVIFDPNFMASNNFSYMIRSKLEDTAYATLSPDDKFPNKRDSSPVPSSSQPYTQAFISIQILVNEAYLDVKAKQLGKPRMKVI